MTDEQRKELLKLRREQKLPWHSPPHRAGSQKRFHITAACFNHQPIIGTSPNRMAQFEETLLSTVGDDEVYAWAILPNHYHILLKTDDILILLQKIGKMHGRLSFKWNGEENQRGRQVWCNALETAIKSDNHFWSAVNYVNNNPVRHGYVKKWHEWPFSSAAAYVDKLGCDKVKTIWQNYPITGFGDGWDDPEL